MGDIECEHERTFTLQGKADDRFSWSCNDHQSDSGYAPEVGGLCGGDYFEVEVCLHCHVVIGFSSDDVEDLLAELEEEDLDGDDEELDFDDEEE